MYMNREDTYEKMVKVLAKSGHDILDEMDPKKAHLVHMGLGLAGEVGELVDAIKKRTMYDKSIDTENIIEELGDIEFFMESLRDALGITRDQTLDANIKKLSIRYKGMKYSNKAAHERADKKTGE
tara:strand:+ start:1285 stop:1659 length:375 start_codon:yes stop_codon:yes gene_type:complete